ncbi:MAG TPA: hypothetical protein VGS08_02670 [Candidatus Saccharimonadales bacterium]|nr:hypothetical protein [Candidatus Saccharimonadales bacterium]
MAVETYNLISNPGTASRKYALFSGQHWRASLHFEQEGDRFIYTYQDTAAHHTNPIDMPDLDHAVAQVAPLLKQHGVLPELAAVSRIGLRIVAPGSFFLENHPVDSLLMRHLETAKRIAPLHVTASLEEFQNLSACFAHVPIYAISDSSFHSTKPDWAWNYGIPLDDADRLDIKRFGYHGLSVSSVVHTLRQVEKMPPRLVVCHLGSGASVTAVEHGKSIDTTMGFSPLEGLIMATRSGSIDAGAVLAIKQHLGLTDKQLETYLNRQAGLLGLSGLSSDIRELLGAESTGNHRAELALGTYVYSVQKAIGQMAAALGGIDVLVFTGTVGQRSAVIRKRIAQNLTYMDISLDKHENASCIDSDSLICISTLAHSKPVFVIPTNEALEMNRQLQDLD